MNEIYKMTYKIGKKDKKIKILGEKFVSRNKYKCHLIYRNKKLPLQKEISVKEIKNYEIKLKIVGLNAISDLSNLFQGCSALLYFEKSSTQKNYYKSLKESDEEQDIIEENDIFNYNETNNENSEEIKNKINLDNQYEQSQKIDSTEKIILTMTTINENISFLFSDIDEAIGLLDKQLKKISKNELKIVDMSNMFFQCLSLKSIPDLSKINTENVIDISNMFMDVQV